MQLLHFKQKPLAMLLAVSAIALSTTAQWVHADTTSQVATQQSYDISAGSLTSVLNSFAQAAGVVLSFDPALTAGKTSNGIKGSYTLKQGFDTLLRDAGLQVAPAADGGYTLKKVPLSSVSSQADVLPEVSVKASAEKTAVTENSGSYTSNLVTIGKGEQRLRDIPQSISIVTRQRMEDQNLTTVAEAMEQVTGVTVRSYGSGTSGFLLRGYDLSAIQVDGLAVQADTGTWGNSTFDLATYDRIEVLRGAAGLLQGAGEPGGTINLVRKHARAEQQIKTILQAGSWDSYRGEVDVTGALNSDGSLRGRFVAVYDDRKSFIDYVYSRKPLFYGTLEYDLTANTTLSVGATVQSQELMPTLGLPTYANGTTADIKRSTFIGSRWDYKNEHTRNYFAEAEHRFDGGAKAKLRLSVMDRDMDMVSSTGNSYINPNTGNVARRLLAAKVKTQDYGLDAYFTSPWEWLGREHQLMAGINSRVYRNSTARNNFSDTQNVFNPNVDLPRPDFVLEDPDVVKTTQTGIYGRAVLQVLNQTKLILGGRVSNWKTETKDVPEAYDNITQRFTPYIGLVQELNQNFSLYASYSDIFVPQIDQRADRSVLKPRIGKQYETGIKGEFDGGRLNMHAAIFRIVDQNRSLTDPNNPDFAIAAGKVRSQGFESEISGSVTPRLDLFAGYAYTETKYLDAEEELQGLPFAPNVPKQLLKVWSKFRLTGDASQGWSLGGGFNINSGVLARRNGVTWEQGGYTVASMQVNYRINPQWDLSLNGNNIFDKRYYSRLDGWSRQSFFGDPQNFMLTLRGSF